jgi:tetratricopeptide (TPR) repeat protein
LIDGPSGNHLWADRYEGAIADVFDLQDRITESVVGAIQPSVRSAEIERSRRKRPENLDAYDLVLRAYPSVWSLERPANMEALKLLEQAIAIEPDYQLALSKGLLDQPAATWAYRNLIPTLVLLGRHDDARAYLSRLLTEYPDLTIAKIRSALVFSQPTLERLAEGLRLAGMQE